MKNLKPRGRIRWGIAALAVTAFAAVPAAAGASPTKSQVIVQVDASASVGAVEAQVRQWGGQVTGELPIIHGFAAELSDGAAASLQRADGVAAVTKNAAIKPQSINATELQNAYPSSTDAIEAWNKPDASVTGKGVGVAVIDTGIAGQMRDFAVTGSTKESRVIASAVVNPNATSARDTYGHGTHVAGIIAGNGTLRNNGDWLDNEYVGIAPEANLISIKASDDAGNATVLDVIYGLQFAVDNKAAYNIRVVNLSLESTTPNSYKTDPLDAAVESAWLKGLVVVAAAGNRGSDADAVQYAPGNDPYAISVGALDDQASQADGDDSRASWSSRGVTQDGVAKPDIHAPGAHIVSTLAPNSAFATLCPTCIVQSQMIRAGGTSMSAPMVAGAAALLLQKYPNLTPNQVKGVLIGSSRLVNARFPALDIYSAIKSVAAGNVPVANQGLTPNTLVSASSGDIDYTRSSWSRSSWSTADPSLGLDFARSSWSRSSWSSYDSSGIETTRSSWSRSSWSTSWTK
jgi:serine protease AprX